MFSSKSFIVSGLTLRSLIHFEFIFAMWFKGLNPFFCMWVSSFSNTDRKSVV